MIKQNVFTIELIQQDTVQYNTVEHSRKGNGAEKVSKINVFTIVLIQFNRIQYSTIQQEGREKSQAVSGNGTQCVYYRTDSIGYSTVQYSRKGENSKSEEISVAVNVFTIELIQQDTVQYNPLEHTS